MVIRMPLRFKNCLEKGLLRKIPASEDNAIRSINKAGSWLKEAEKSFQGEALLRNLNKNIAQHRLYKNSGITVG